MINNEDLRLFLREAIASKAFVLGSDELVVSPSGVPESWLFDFRRIIVSPDILNAYAELFVNTYKNMYPYQVGCLEVAGIPLISAIVMKSYEKGIPVNGFFIRKSRKKSGLLRAVEGEINHNPIILVDDILNSGSTFMRQIEVLNSLNKDGVIDAKIERIVSILQFRDVEEYSFFLEKGIQVDTFFQLKELQKDLHGITFPKPKPVLLFNVFDIAWSVKIKNPNYWLVSSRGGVLISDGVVYLGADTKEILGFDTVSGVEVFHSIVGRGKENRRVFSKMFTVNENIVFGTYDGNIYSINRETKKRNFVVFDYNYSGGEIACTENDNSVLFFHSISGVFTKKSSIVALDTTTSETLWCTDIDHSDFAHCAYSSQKNIVIVTTETGLVTALQAKNGKVLWKTVTKLSFVTKGVFDDDGRYFLIGSITFPDPEDIDIPCIVIDTKTGEVAFSFSEESMFCASSPYVVGDVVYLSSLNKHVYAFSLSMRKKIWSINLEARIFSEPRLVTWKSSRVPKLYVGTNNGQLVEIDPTNGTILSKTFFSERITDPVSYDDKHDQLYLVTYVNEVYCLKRKQ